MKKFHDKIKLDDFFKDELNDFRDTPGNHVWDNIEKKLPDIVYFNKLSGTKWLFPSITIAAITTFTALLNSERIENFLISNNEESVIEAVQKPMHKQLLAKTDHLPVNIEKLQNAKPVDPDLEQTPISTLSKITKPIQSKDLIVNISNDMNARALIHEYQNKNQNYNNNKLPILTINEIESNYKNEGENFYFDNLVKPSNILRQYNKALGLSVGLVLRLNNTWIINQNTYGEFDGYELAYKPDFGYTYGFKAGYDFSARFGVQVEWVNSYQGQKYVDMIYRELVRREVDLTYMKVPILLKYKYNRISPATSKLIVRNYLIGFEYGFLKSAQITTYGERINSLTKFEEHEGNIVLGLDYDIFLNDHFFITLGGRGTIGTDINSIKWRVKDNYRKSHNFLLGINTGISYLF